MRETIEESVTRTKQPLVSFLCIIVFFQAMGGLMGWITAQGVDSWYQTLQRSPLNPPDFVFGIVWTGLYLLLGIAFWLVWQKPRTRARAIAMGLFLFHMILNWAWSPLFFAFHAVGASVLVILLMIFTAAMLLWLLWPLDRRAALVFVPYIGWLGFAGHLSHYIWKMN